MNEVGRYRKVLGVDVPVKQIEPEKDKSAEVTVHGSGWRVSVPVVAITTVLAFVGGRYTPTPKDAAIERMENNAAASKLQTAQLIESLSEQVKSLRQEMRDMKSEMNNRFVFLDERLKQQSTR